MSAAFDFLNGVFTSIVHGDIPHQEWLRDRLLAFLPELESLLGKVYVVEAHDSVEGLYAIRGIYLDFEKAMQRKTELDADRSGRMTETWTDYKIVEHKIE